MRCPGVVTTVRGGELLPDGALIGIAERWQYRAPAVAIPVEGAQPAHPIRSARYALPASVVFAAGPRLFLGARNLPWRRRLWPGPVELEGH